MYIMKYITARLTHLHYTLTLALSFFRANVSKHVVCIKLAFLVLLFFGYIINIASNCTLLYIIVPMYVVQVMIMVLYFQ